MDEKFWRAVIIEEIKQLQRFFFFGNFSIKRLKKVHFFIKIADYKYEMADF